jgi:hypothetical protein
VFETHFTAAGAAIIGFGFAEGGREVRLPLRHNRHHIQSGTAGAQQHGEDF